MECFNRLGVVGVGWACGVAVAGEHLYTSSLIYFCFPHSRTSDMCPQNIINNMSLIRFIFLQLTICFKLTLSAPHFRSSTTSLPGITIIPSPTTGETRSQERQPWLVFTSAGDHSAVGQWLAGRHYDIMTVYYGKEPQAFPYRDLVDIYRARQGCKFCNLKYYHETEPELFAKYRYGSVVLPN
jgi:hypothetical protein